MINIYTIRKSLIKIICILIIFSYNINANVSLFDCPQLGYDGFFYSNSDDSFYCYNDSINSEVTILETTYNSSSKMDVYGPFVSSSNTPYGPFSTLSKEMFTVILDNNGNYITEKPVLDENFLLDYRILFKEINYIDNTTSEGAFSLYAYSENLNESFSLFQELKGIIKTVKKDEENNEQLKLESNGDFIIALKMANKDNELNILGYLKFPFILTINYEGSIYKYVGEFYDEIDSSFSDLFSDIMTSKLIRVLDESDNGELTLADTYSAEITMKSDNTIDIYGFDTDNNKVLLNNLSFD